MYMPRSSPPRADGRRGRPELAGPETAKQYSKQGTTYYQQQLKQQTKQHKQTNNFKHIRSSV